LWILHAHFDSLRRRNSNEFISNLAIKFTCNLILSIHEYSFDIPHNFDILMSLTVAADDVVLNNLNIYSPPIELVLKAFIALEIKQFLL